MCGQLQCEKLKWVFHLSAKRLWKEDVNARRRRIERRDAIDE